MNKSKLIKFFTTPSLISIVLFFGFLLWSYHLGTKSFWSDEILSIRHAQVLRNIAALFSIQCGNAHPPLFFLLLRPWILLGGESESWTRFLPVLLALPTVPLVYFIGKHLKDSHTGIIASALYIFMPLMLIYNREVRMYSLLNTLSCVSLLLLLKAIDRNKISYWCSYSFVTFLTLITHYHGFLILTAQGIFFLLYLTKIKDRRLITMRFALAVGASLLLFLPFLPALQQSIGLKGVMWLSGAKSLFISRGYLAFSLALGQTIMPWNWIAILGGVAFIALSVYGLWYNRTNYVLVFIVISYFIVVFLVGPSVSHDMPRYYLFLAPLLCIILSCGITSVGHKLLPFFLMIALLLSWFSADINYFRGKDFHILAHVDPWRDVAEFLKGHAGGDDKILIKTSDALEFYYLPMQGLETLVIGDYSKITDAQSPQNIWIVIGNPGYTDLGSSIREELYSRYGYKTVEVSRFLQDPNYLKKQKFFNKPFAEYRIEVFRLNKYQDRIGGL